MFRAVAARLDHLSQDRPDIKFATKKLSSKMSRQVARLEGHGLGVCLHALADADWAGDKQSRKSVSREIILHGKHRSRLGRSSKAL